MTKNNATKWLQKNNVKFVRFFFPDILGEACDFSVPIQDFGKALTVGKGFDGSSIHGMARIDESDLTAMPDLKTLKILPWQYECKTMPVKWQEAIVFCDILKPNGNHYEGDTRFVLKNLLSEMKIKKIMDKFYVGPELEFFLFKADEDGRPIVKDGKPILMDYGNYFKGGRFGEVRKEVQFILQEMGINSEFDHHEAAFSQHEIDYNYMDALEMADTVLLLKYITKRVARKYGLFASFMPKPVSNVNGSGMHVNLSLFKHNQNLFYDRNTKDNLSSLAKHFIGGLIHYIKEMTSIFNQYVNSYKRVVPGYEAPCYITWAYLNRSDLIRIPNAATSDATRIELRSPDSSCNPYLTFALMLKAGVEGVKNKISPPKPVQENVYKLTEREKKIKNIECLPSSLKEALQLTQNSSLVNEVFGEHLFNKFIENKQIHLQEYFDRIGNKEVIKITSYEIEKLLPIL
jgi:glutamine synthetase